MKLQLLILTEIAENISLYINGTFVVRKRKKES